jgi:hypothetical protein
LNPAADEISSVKFNSTCRSLFIPSHAVVIDVLFSQCLFPLWTGCEKSQQHNSLCVYAAAWDRTTYGVSIALKLPHGLPDGPSNGFDG